MYARKKGYAQTGFVQRGSSAERGPSQKGASPEKGFSQRGFTLVEMVITIAVVTIIALTATSIVLTSQNIRKKLREDFYAVNLCTNSVEIFRSVDGEDIPSLYDEFRLEFGSSLGYTLDETLSSSDGKTYAVSFGLDSDWKQSSSSKFSCSITFEQADEIEGNKMVFFRIQVCKNGNELSSASYTAAIGESAP